MTKQPYSHPVSQLLEYGNIEFRQYPDYLALGFTDEHIPELIRLMQDEFDDYDENDASKIRWAAPIHAWRTLAQLKAEAAIPAFLSLLYEIDEKDNDLACEEFPELLAMIGSAAIPALQSYLHNEQHGLYARVAAAHALEQIGNAHPEARLSCIECLEKTLAFYRSNDEDLNGFLISYLVDLRSIDSLPLIRKVFAAELIDLQMEGDIEDVEIRLGVRTKRSTPRPRLSPSFPMLTDFFEDNEPYTSPTKIGRNEPCPCGSGKKYKKCCLNSER